MNGVKLSGVALSNIVREYADKYGLESIELDDILRHMSDNDDYRVILVQDVPEREQGPQVIGWFLEDMIYYHGIAQPRRNTMVILAIPREDGYIDVLSQEGNWYTIPVNEYHEIKENEVDYEHEVSDTESI